MSNIDPTKAFDRAVDLVIHGDNLANTWTGRLVAVQSSLIVAEGALLIWKGNQSGSIVGALAALIGVIAIASLFALCRILVREHDTGHAYIAMVKRAEGNDPYLFRDGDSGPPGPSFSRNINALKWLLVVAWTFFLVVVVHATFR